MRPVKFVACHYQGKSGRGKPACFITEDAARDLVEAGQAKWDKRCKYLNFTKLEAALPVTPQSISMGPSVIEGCAAGVDRYLAMLRGWMPVMIGRVV